MKTHTLYRPFLLLFGILLLNGCKKDDDTNDSSNANAVVNSLESLAAQFNANGFTHVDYLTTSGEILDLIIVSAEVKSSTNIFDFTLLEIKTKSAPNLTNPDGKILLTFSPEAEPETGVNGTLVGNWSETNVRINGVSQPEFEPRAFLLEAEISTTVLVTLEEELAIRFKTL